MKCILNKISFHSKKVERSHGLNFTDSLHTLLVGLNHGLSKDNLRKYKLKCKLWQLFWLKFMYFSTVAVMITTIAIILLIVYMITCRFGEFLFCKIRFGEKPIRRKNISFYFI